MEDDPSKVCSRYGMDVRRTSNESTTALREADKKESAAFGREVLEEQLPKEWFEEMDMEARKTLTGFLFWTSRGKQHFNEDYGQAYVAKPHYLQETTKNMSNRFNFKRRAEEVLAHK